MRFVRTPYVILSRAASLVARPVACVAVRGTARPGAGRRGLGAGYFWAALANTGIIAVTLVALLGLHRNPRSFPVIDHQPVPRRSFPGSPETCAARSLSARPGGRLPDRPPGPDPSCAPGSRVIQNTIRRYLGSGSSEATAEKLAQPIRSSLTDPPPSLTTYAVFLAHPALGQHPGGTPILDGLLQAGQPPELEPESEAPADRGGVGCEVPHSAIDQVLGRFELRLSAYVDRAETNRRRWEPGHRSGAIGQEATPISPQMHARTPGVPTTSPLTGSSRLTKDLGPPPMST